MMRIGKPLWIDVFRKLGDEVLQAAVPRLHRSSPWQRREKSSVRSKFWLSLSVMQALHHTLMAYAQQQLTTLPQDYRWKLKPEHVEQAFGLVLSAGSPYAMTRALKRGLAQQWQTMPQRRLALADYAVREWGGVRTNAPATL
ncbi:MAG: hypothetical protein ACI4QS_11600, partial [Comamonas sp.]